MKSSSIICCIALALLPALGWGQGKSSSPSSSGMALVSMPISEDGGEVRSADSLRDSLRLPYDDAKNEPYRLTRQELQRLREQLRGQTQETSKK